MITTLIIYLILNAFIAGLSFKNMDGYTFMQKTTLTISYLLIGMPVFIWFRYLEKYYVKYQVQFFIDLWFTKTYSRRFSRIELNRLKVLYIKFNSDSTSDKLFRYCARKVFVRNGIEI